MAVRDSVIDVAFCGEMPGLYEALTVTDLRRTLVLEVEELLDAKKARTIALGSTDGLVRSLPVERTRRVVHVPVGPATLDEAASLG